MKNSIILVLTIGVLLTFSSCNNFSFVVAGGSGKQNFKVEIVTVDPIKK